MNIQIKCYCGCFLKDSGSLHRTETNVGFVFLCAPCLKKVRG